MNLKPFLALAATSALVTACSPGILSCSDDDVTDLVKQIISDQDDKEITDQYRISNVRLDDRNNEIEKISCSGDLFTYYESQEKEIKRELKYTAQVNEEGRIYFEAGARMRIWK